MVSELGKAKYLPIDKLEVGMKVHRDVLGRKDRVLVNAGEILSRKHVDKLNQWERRTKPIGPAMPKQNIKNRFERVNHSEFIGGWRPSHFNKNGVLVSSTLASGLDVPAVEANPELSPAIQSMPKKSFSMGDTGIDSPIQRKWKIADEIKTLEMVNTQLGGSLHNSTKTLHTEEAMVERRDMLKSENDDLIKELKEGKSNGTKLHPQPGRPKRKKR